MPRLSPSFLHRYSLLPTWSPLEAVALDCASQQANSSSSTYRRTTLSSSSSSSSSSTYCRSIPTMIEMSLEPDLRSLCCALTCSPLVFKLVFRAGKGFYCCFVLNEITCSIVRLLHASLLVLTAFAPVICSSNSLPHCSAADRWEFGSPIMQSAEACCDLISCSAFLAVERGSCSSNGSPQGRAAKPAPGAQHRHTRRACRQACTACKACPAPVQAAWGWRRGRGGCGSWCLA